ncbi:peptidase domain-containing ABC transporter [Enterobacteriaceae bacterium BIT-l23]|uniref:peptidase domain-containing ABC transporter n=1 Tax=Jejubacter sp. L23 TaxID=3092086 RepID=UPI001584A170|nr:peptidase domain-containing ABC transporter [Enterobacteriaceae bacterium BIT-l23]
MFSLFQHRKPGKTPLIRQHEFTECGLACVAMVMGHYEHHVSISQLRRELSVSAEAGTSMAELLQLAEGKGMDGRVLQGDVKELQNAQLPLIAFWRGNHFVVIVKADSRAITIHDPACGARRYSYREAAKLFSGFVLELKPRPEFKKRDPDDQLTLGALGQKTAGLFQRQVLLFALSIFTLITMLASPSYVQLIMDEAISRSDSDLVILLTAIFAIVFIFEVIGRFLKQLLEIFMRNIAYDDLSQSIRGYMLRTQAHWFQSRPPGIVLAIEKSLHACADFISNGYVQLIYSGLIALTSLIFMLFYNVEIALLTLLMMGVFFIIRFSLIGPYQRAVDDSIERTAQYESLLVETQKGIITLKANNMERARDAVMDKSMREHIAALMRKERLLARFDVASLLVINAEQLLVVCLGAWLILEGQMSIGMLYAYISYKRYFSDAMVQVAQKLLDKNALKGPLDRVGDLLFSPTEASQFGKTLVTSPVSIHFDNVSFAWPGHDNLLHNITMTINAGEELTIIGQSGSGKTTLLRLISGMLQPTGGELNINKTPINECDLSSLRQHVRIVHADDILFTGSILENIACFDSNPDRERVIEACQMAEVHHVIERLQHGYDTALVPGNSFFSAGETQRLVLARALYGQPKLLLCDEVTANLDKTTAQRVLANLRSLGIGLVFVTHSPEVIDSRGRCYVMERGRLRAMEETPS